jgi:hypothetical protein
MKRPQWFWVAIAVSLIASLTPWGPTLLYPFKLFTTWVHESQPRADDASRRAAASRPSRSNPDTSG